MMKKLIGGAVAALLVSTGVAASAATAVPAGAVQQQGIKSGIRAGSVKKAGSAATDGAGGAVIIGGAAVVTGFVLWKAIDWSDGDDNDSPQ